MSLHHSPMEVLGRDTPKKEKKSLGCLKSQAYRSRSPPRDRRISPPPPHHHLEESCEKKRVTAPSLLSAQASLQPVSASTLFRHGEVELCHCHHHSPRMGNVTPPLRNEPRSLPGRRRFLLHSITASLSPAGEIWECL